MRRWFVVSSRNAADEGGLPPGCSARCPEFCATMTALITAFEFWEELNSFINKAAANPHRFHLETRDRRRVNLKRFPYHFLFREIPNGIRITVVRHNKQHPERGLERR